MAAVEKDYKAKIKLPLVFGCGGEPMLVGADCTEMLDSVYACGINMFDTAEKKR